MEEKLLWRGRRGRGQPTMKTTTKTCTRSPHTHVHGKKIPFQGQTLPQNQDWEDSEVSQGGGLFEIKVKKRSKLRKLRFRNLFCWGWHLRLDDINIVHHYNNILRSMNHCNCDFYWWILSFMIGVRKYIIHKLIGQLK